jgi:hypothetical protein
MQQRYELIDIVVAIGVCATIVAGGLFFMAANGTVSFSRSGEQTSERPIGRMDSMQWLQPVLGQAMVDQYLLERHNTNVTLPAATQLQRVTADQMRWQNSPFGYLDSIKSSAARAESDHAMRVQAVMGRLIVNFTRRGVRSDMLLSEGNIMGFNARMIDATDALGQRMDARFVANWQANLGRAIVAASQENAKGLALRQEWLDVAMVRVDAAQTAYEGRRAAIQEQLGGATVVAIRTESQTGLSEHVRSAQYPAVTVAAKQGWPDLPMSTMVVASLVLMSLFVAGLLVSPTFPAANMVKMVKLGPAALAYPETV